MTKDTIANNSRWGYFLWAGIAALFFIPFLGGVHLFDWDEINFAEISREMLRQQDYLRVSIDYEAFFQKPPFFFWLQVLSMLIFGEGEFAARFPNALCGIITLLLLFHLGRRLYGLRFGHLWALSYLGSVLPFLYFKSGIIDPWFNLFIFLGLYHIILYYWKKEGFEFQLAYSKWWYLFCGGLFLGLGILTKGPVAYLLVCLTLFVYWLYQRFRFYITVPAFLFLSLIAILCAGTWFGLETLSNGPDFFNAFWAYNIELASTESAGHGGFPGYHFVVLLLGCFPASIFALRSFFGLPESEKDFQNDFRVWMKYLFWVVLVVFTLVSSKIVHYSSLCYFPLTFLNALVIHKILSGEIPLNKWMRGLILGIAALYSLIIITFPIVGRNVDQLSPLIKDAFTRGNLEASVNWTGWEVLPAFLLITILVIAWRQFKKEQQWRALGYLYFGTALFTFFTIVFFIKRIEGYSQRANIEFFKSLKGENAYVYTYGYKSFAHLYYSDKAPGINDPIKGWDSEKRQNWLLEGNIDKPVYLSVRIHRAEDIRKRPQFEELRQKNGFVFFRRMPE